MTLAGKKVLITGGGTGVGADLAVGFAKQGATVLICGRRKEPLDATQGKHQGITLALCDITDEASVMDLFQKNGPFDIVIANAGQAGSSPFAKTTLAQWNNLLAVNLTGTFLVFREALVRMKGWGRLISICSTAGLKGYARVAPYAAAKHGVVGLTRSLALEVSSRPITVNAICPGFLDTEMTQESIQTIVAKTGRSAAEARAALEAFNPQNRLFQPSEVTATALWLCSEGAEGVNGQAISISGGEI